MRNIVTPFLVLITVFCATAQQPHTSCESPSPVTFGPCPTGITEPGKPLYQEMVRNLDVNILNSRSGIQYIPVHYFIITKDDTTCGADLRDILDNHCEMNETYNPFGIGFYISAIDTIASTYYWNFDNMGIGSAVEEQYDDDSSCNVFVNGNLPGLCGYSSLPQTQPTGGGIWLNRVCVSAGQKTFQHEMGHFFSLLHTFETAFGVELVNESNCTTAGDLLCDTPADFLDHSGDCPYFGYATDTLGERYNPDPSIIMSYFSDYCKSRFSTMEKAAMVTTLNTTRAYQLNHPMPDPTPLDTAACIAPIAGDTTVNGNNCIISWHPVNRAIYYRFILASATSPMIFMDTLITDTDVYVGNLFPGMEYRYIARPISYGNACASLSNYQVIKTSPIAVNLYAASPVCYSDLSDTLIATPTGGVPPYTYYWSNYSGDSMQTGIAAGEYSLTVIDYANHRVVTSANIVFPEPLEVDISVTPNNLVADVTGGSAPYQYQWSNGGKDRFNSHPAYGQYTVTVTDSRGCSTEKEILYAGLGPVVQISHTMKLFPNPVTGPDVLNIQIELPSGEEGAVSLVNMNGEIVSQLRKEFISGTNNLRVNVGMLPAGVYIARYISSGNSATEKFSVLR